VSNAHVAWAFAQKGLPPTRKFVLVALAERCNKDTLRCDPSVKRVAEDTGLAERTVFRALEDLEAGGLISRVERRRENGSTTSSEYRFPGVTVSVTPRQRVTPPPDSVSPPEPEVEPEVEQDLAAAPRVSRKHPMWDPIWDVLTEGFGPATTKDAQSRRGKAVKALVEAGATPEDVIARGKRWRRHFPGATLTQEALVKWWDTLPRKELR
jgi:DNA-binding MarR family transcriptional regulator